MQVARILGLVAVITLAAGCQQDENAGLGAEETLAMTTLKYEAGSAHPDGELVQGVFSAIQDKRLTVIRDQATFARLWDEHVANVDPKPSRPAVDFNSTMVIAAFAGEKPVAGHLYSITEVLEYKDEISVVLRLDRPGPACLVAQVNTQPYHMVALPDSSKTVRFVELADGYSC